MKEDNGYGGFINKHKIKFFFIFLLIFLFSCAKSEIKLLSEEDVLRERIMNYWSHIIKEELDKAYDYEYPLGKMTLSKYIARKSNPMIKYKGFEIRSISINGDTADVEMEIVPVIKVPGERPFEHKTVILERWAKVDGIWYHVTKKDF
jgi:hypothetical protein